MKLGVLREESRFYCDACAYASQVEAGAVRCEHPDVAADGLARVIVFSHARCPKGSWDHTAHKRSTPRPASERAARQIEESPAPCNPAPCEHWPATLDPFIARRSDNEKGVGDTLKRLGDAGDAPALQLLIELTKPCSCWARKPKANRMYPYAGVSSQGKTHAVDPSADSAASTR